MDATRTGPLLYTHIIHKANLSSTDADELLALLLARELVYKTGDGRYLPTTLGIKYCLAYQKMASLIDEAIPCAILDNSGVLPTVYGEPVVRGKHVAR